MTPSRSYVPVSILYEDNHLLVVEKPINVPTQEDASGDSDLLNQLKADVKRRYDKPGAVFLGLVHRLDRPVGGVMVFARTSKSAARLAEQVRDRSFGKTYFAVAEGDLPSRGSLVHHLWKDRDRNRVSVVSPGRAGAKEARLRYEVVERRGESSLVRVELETGRSHQIRVQFATIGCPLYGDHRYGSARGSKRQLALWSTRIEITHPTRKDRMRFESLPPARDPWDRFDRFTLDSAGHRSNE